MDNASALTRAAVILPPAFIASVRAPLLSRSTFNRFCFTETHMNILLVYPGIVTAMVGLLNAPAGTRLHSRLEQEGGIIISLPSLSSFEKQPLLQSRRGRLATSPRPGAFFCFLFVQCAFGLTRRQLTELFCASSHCSSPYTCLFHRLIDN